MPQSLQNTRNVLQTILSSGAKELLLQQLISRPPSQTPLPKRIPAGNDYRAEAVQERRQFLASQGIVLKALARDDTVIPPISLKGNIENLIGFASIPVGVIGPLRINGFYAHGDFFVPMATTEGAMVASYHRGAHIISRAGGAAAICLTESVSRAPCFYF